MDRSRSNAVLEETSFLYGSNAVYLEELYEQYLRNPDSVDASWAEVFEAMGGAPETASQPSWARSDWPPQTNGEMTSALDTNWGRDAEGLSQKIAAKAPAASAEQIRSATTESVRAIMMIRAFRVRGHLDARLDPLSLEDKEPHPELDPRTYGFSEEDLDRPIFIDHVLGLETATLREILTILRRTYCSTIGYEFMHITDPEEKAWLQERIEGPGKEVSFTKNGKLAILNKLIESEGFEKFLHVKFTGTKRFGLDGGEALVPAMEQIIKRGGNLGLEEIVLGMPHRGRLNVLAAVMGKPYRAIINEFLGGSAHPEDVDGSGDVKYHLGASSDREFDGNMVHLSLTANPSHLEAVNPVVLGKVRAKQTQRDDIERNKVMPVLLHGDAAFAGQGMVSECFGMSGLKGHRTGGTIHIIVNNQIGFTTSPQFSRSSPYPSDVALMVQAPIFHVNGDDPEAVTHVAKVATEFRQRFNKDVVIDMFCYRRHGHNEGDEPMFTQPLMYKKVKGHATTLKVYGEKLVNEGVLTAEDLQSETDRFQQFLSDEFEAAQAYRPNKADWLEGRWVGFKSGGEEEIGSQTDVDMSMLKAVGEKLCHIPEGFNIHRTLKRIIGQKSKMIETGEGLDWATAEALAFGTLLTEGFPVRLSGQDSMRGTFSHRHSGWVDQETEERYYPLQNLSDTQAEFEVIDSMLSEEAVLGFEYGHSLTEPNALTLWEAQFGDFANGAQVIIDQFIASGERKWLRMSGLVMLLPHGYEGQGPEHSSARLERYLQLCAEDNMQVVNCTTPANYFHALRRQLHRKIRKPLIVMSPKSLLRHKRCVSTLDDMGPGSTFLRVLTDGAENDGGSVRLKPDQEIRRVILCSGKVYYDLYEEREARGIEDIQIIRVEQLYPFPAMTLMKELGRFPNADFVWCQEEPKNMGAWTFIEPNIEWVLTKLEVKHTRPHYVGRHATASTATGLMRRHMAELEAFLNEALTLED
ncbi:MAG: 2-oxoglutarate dehydrogenase E1 component [Alphaproteobacteria bacterium]|nr:MAG: 2-oxoglutarate dehydrogenase E1 component [Alphaproteobacteria bacterium]